MTDMTKDRVAFKFLSRTIGYGTGWDGDPGTNFWIYDFQPVTNFPVDPCDTFAVNETNGTFEAVDDKGNITKSWDILEALKNVPKD